MAFSTSLVSLFGFQILIRLSILIVGQIEHQIAQPLLELRIVRILLEQLHIVCHDRENDFLQYAVAFSARLLLVAVAHGILILFVAAECREFPESGGGHCPHHSS